MYLSNLTNNHCSNMRLQMADISLPDKIINLIFEETGQQLTRDDPVLGLIIAQQRLLDDKLIQLECGIQDYSNLIKQGQDSLNVSLESLKKYREDILNDLASETMRQADKVVDSALSNYGNILITSHVSRIQSLLVTVNKMVSNRIMGIYFGLFLVLILISWVALK